MHLYKSSNDVLNLHMDWIWMHLRNTYLDALTYSANTSSNCLSRRTINRLFLRCYSFALSNNVNFSTMKTRCIKYAEHLKDSEKIIFDGVQLKYYEIVCYFCFNNGNNCTAGIKNKCCGCKFVTIFR